jgi:hypothetical protein
MQAYEAPLPKTGTGDYRCCRPHMRVVIRGEGRDHAVPVSQLFAVNADESTAEALAVPSLGRRRLLFLIYAHLPKAREEAISSGQFNTADCFIKPFQTHRKTICILKSLERWVRRLKGDAATGATRQRPVIRGFWKHCPWRVSSGAGHTERFSATDGLSRINLLLRVRSRVALPLGAAPGDPVGLSSPSSSRCLSQLSDRIASSAFQWMLHYA